MATRYAGQRPRDALLNGPTQLVHEGIAELAAPGANPLGWINSAQVTVVAGERAFGKFSTTSTHLYKDTQLFAAQFPAVCVFRFYSDDVTSNNMVTTLGDVSNPGTNSRFQIDFDSGNLRCLAAGSSVTSISTPVSTGQWYTGVYVARSSTDKFLALGGKAIGADTGSSPMPHAFTRIMVGDLASGSTPTGGGNYLPGYVSFCEWLPISVSDAQAVEWSRDYGQMFAPQSSRAPVAAGSATTSIACGVGAASVSGHVAGIALHTAVSAGVGAASAQGHGVGIAAHTVVSAGVGAATATGHLASIVSHTAINAGVGAATAAGHQAAITVGSSTAITCGTGAATAQGHQAAISLGTAIACGIGAAAAAGHQAAIATHTVIAAGVGAASAQGLQAGIALHTVIACGAGAASATGAQATIGVSTSIACGVGHAGATGHQATITVGNGTAIGCGTGAATAQGHAATVGVGASIACAVGAAVASGYQAGIAQRTVISGNVAQATAQGMQAGIVVHAVISTGVGAANARGYPATVTVGGITPEYPLCLTVEISAETVLHVRTGNPVSTIDVLIQPDTRFKPRVLSC